MFSIDDLVCWFGSVDLVALDGQLLSWLAGLVDFIFLIDDWLAGWMGGCAGWVFFCFFFTQSSV